MHRFHRVKIEFTCKNSSVYTVRKCNLHSGRPNIIAATKTTNRAPHHTCGEISCYRDELDHLDQFLKKNLLKSTSELKHGKDNGI